MKHPFLRIISFSLLVVMAAPLSATVMMRLSEADLVDHSQAIIIGTCVESESLWRGRSLVTKVTVQVSETLKGEVGETATVWVPGGYDFKSEVPVGRFVPGAPVFSRNEEVVLFLEQPEAMRGHGFAVLGLAQGKFTIAMDGDGKPAVKRHLAGARLVGSGDMAASGSSSLDAFKARIRALLEQD